MKKKLVLLVACILFITSLTCISAEYQNINLQTRFNIILNGEPVSNTSFVCNNTYYFPLRTIFEKMGSSVFYRARDRQILALSRDGDMIRHIVGTNVINVNGEDKVFSAPSVIENDGAYISVEMLSAALCPDQVSYDSKQVCIQKNIHNLNYHKIIKDILDYSKNENFKPEKFKDYIAFHGNNPSYSMDDVIFRVNVGLDHPFYENIKTIEDPYALLVLCNKYNKLPAGYTQYNLVNMRAEYTVRDGKQYLLAGVANDNYMKMADAAKKAGLSMKVVSAYRTEDYQRGLYNNKLKATGRVNADNYSARPGHSEHQTGLAVDINSTSGTFEYTAEFKWLQKHAHEYGFILRYPKGKEWITGYAYEPWHYRYVGIEVATRVYEEGITYEEFYSKYIDANEFK